MANRPQCLDDYLRLWNERDLSKLAEQLQQTIAADCLWVDPLRNHQGRDALEANIKEFRQTYPTAKLSLGSNVDGHNGRYRYLWRIHVDGELLITGMDVVTVNAEGLIERVDGFFGELTPLQS